MKLTIAKRPDGKPDIVYENDSEKWNNLHPGEMLTGNFNRIRSPRNHRRYFAMINLGFENQEEYQDVRTYRKSLEMRAGYYDEVELTFKNKEGETHKVKRKWPKSIAYHALDEDNFNLLREKVGDLICADLGIDDKDLQEQVLKLANYF